MFFFETIAFVLIFPLCWWLGGYLAKNEAARFPRRIERDEGGAEIVDLAAYRRRRELRAEREKADGNRATSESA